MWKECTKCGKIKYLWEFSKQKDCLFGVQSICKKCINIDDKKWREKNKDKIAKQRKEWREKNKDKIAKQRKEWCEKNKDKIAKQHKEWYENNKEKKLKKCKEWYENNKEKLLKKSKEYHEKNKEHYLKQYKKYRENNKEYFKKYIKEYNKDKINNLHDPYIKQQLHNTENIPYNEITPEMIELKRQQLKLHREINQNFELIKKRN